MDEWTNVGKIGWVWVVAVAVVVVESLEGSSKPEGNQGAREKTVGRKMRECVVFVGERGWEMKATWEVSRDKCGWEWGAERTNGTKGGKVRGSWGSSGHGSTSPASRKQQKGRWKATKARLCVWPGKSGLAGVNVKRLEWGSKLINWAGFRVDSRRVDCDFGAKETASEVRRIGG